MFYREAEYYFKSTNHLYYLLLSYSSISSLYTPRRARKSENQTIRTYLPSFNPSVPHVKSMNSLKTTSRSWFLPISAYLFWVLQDWFHAMCLAWVLNEVKSIGKSGYVRKFTPIGPSLELYLHQAKIQKKKKALEKIISIIYSKRHFSPL